MNKATKVLLVAATSLDGYIAKNKNDPIDWTSSQDKAYFKSLTTNSGVMVMGRTTYEAIGRPLPGRKSVVMTRSPKQSDNADVEFTDQTPAEIINKLSKDGYECICICGGSEIYNLFLREKLVDEIHLSVEPIIFGAGVRLFDETNLGLQLRLRSSSNLNDDTLLNIYEIRSE